MELARWTMPLVANPDDDGADPQSVREGLVGIRVRDCEDRPQACVRRGVILTRTDLPRAASLFESACASGALDGCANFGVMLVQGRGVPRDLDRGRALLRSTCDEGHDLGCQNFRALPR
jgi:TPR repeat protein